ncbi:hypothetical protein FRC10_008581 [Ceratobasidium sp. 414]|nr:hypothetical protein FRC10_008581 [Ceratobasidium sp. 414]
MSVPRDSPEQDDPVDESEIEHQLEVWVTLTKVVQVQTARTRNAAKTAKETSTMVFFVTLEGLTLGNLGKECSGVKSEADFETMRRVLENKNITTVNIAFDNVDVQRVIPKVDVSSQCEVQLAKLTQELEKTWKCKWSADFTV